MSSPAPRPSPRPRPEPSTASVEPARVEPAPVEPDATAAAAPKARRGSRVVRIARASGRATAASASESGRIWRASRATRGAKSEPQARTEPRFDSSSWLGASIAVIAFTAVPWAVQIVNATQDYRLNRFGLAPREVHGLWGVLTQPFLHASYADMASDTLPVLVIGWVVMLAGARVWLAVTAVVVIVGGALTWLVGPEHTVVLGCSELIFGWLGYLVARAVFSRSIRWIVTAAMVLLVFGALLGQLVPVAHSHQSWQVHVAGFVAGAGIAWLLHPRRNSARGAKRRAAAAAVS